LPSVWQLLLPAVRPLPRARRWRPLRTPPWDPGVPWGLEARAGLRDQQALRAPAEQRVRKACAAPPVPRGYQECPAPEGPPGWSVHRAFPARQAPKELPAPKELQDLKGRRARKAPRVPV